MFLEIILLVATFLVIKLYFLNKKPPGTPPGSVGLPVIGVFPSQDQSFEHFLETCRQKYGDIFWMKIGAYDYVILYEYDDIVEAFNNPAIQGRVNTYIPKLFNKYGEKDPSRREFNVKELFGIINAQGEHWKNLRRFTIRRLRDGGMGKSSMEGIILNEAEALAEDFEKHLGTPTEVPRSVNTSILNVVWRIVGDRRYETDDEEMKTLCAYIGDVMAAAQDRLFIIDMMPWIAMFTPNFVLNYLGQGEMERKLERIYAQMHKAVEEHKKTFDEENPRDFIDSYLIELKKHQNNSPDKSDNCCTFSERELVQALFDLFLAGSETTSSTIKWFLFYMAKYQAIQEKLQKELDNGIKRDQIMTISEKKKFPFLEACISETLRLKSILPFGLFHVATEDTTIRNYNIPKGTFIGANLIANHKDPKHWKKPNEFYPERFINEDGSYTCIKKELIPFSTGRRVCLGENLAMMDLYIVLGTLLQRFTFTVPDGEPMSEEVRAEQPFFTLPKPFKIIINKR